jgi:hypothetical protein
LYRIKTRREATEVASQLKGGELADLLKLTCRFQEMQRLAETREAESKHILEWVRTQPDIKRQYLANRFAWLFEGLISQDVRSTLLEMAD